MTKATPPFDVPGLFSGLAIRSSAWSELDPDGDVVLDQGSLRLTGTNPVRSVFNLTATQLAQASEVFLRVPDGSTALINVTEASFKSNISAFWIWDSGTSIHPAQPADASGRPDGRGDPARDAVELRQRHVGHARAA